MKRLFALFLVLVLLTQAVCAAGSGSLQEVSAIGDADQGVVVLTGRLQDGGGEELTVRIFSDGENRDVLYLNQLAVAQDGSFAFTCPVSLSAGEEALYVLNGAALAESVSGRVRMRMAFTELQASGNAAQGTVSVSGCLRGQSGAEVDVAVRTATGRDVVSGTFTADVDGRFYGDLPAQVRIGDVLLLSLSAEMAVPATELLVIPGSEPEIAQLSGVTITPNVTEQTFTVSGHTEPAGVREITLLATKRGNVIYANQFATEGTGAFTLEFPADIVRGDRFEFRINGAALTAGVERMVDIPYCFADVTASGDAERGSVQFAGRIPGFGSGAISAELSTATGRQLWSGIVMTDGQGNFAREIPLTLTGGEALCLSFTAERAEPYVQQFVVTKGEAERARLTELTIVPDREAGQFHVSGVTEPAGARVLTVQVTKAGNQVYINQFVTVSNGTFVLEIPAAIQPGDEFQFRFNGAALEEGAERTVQIPYEFADVQVSGDAVRDEVKFSGRIPGYGAGTVTVLVTTATGQELWSGAVETDEQGAFAAVFPLQLEPGAQLTLQLQAENTTPYAELFKVPSPGVETVRITELTITPETATQKFVVTGRTEPAGVWELSIMTTKQGDVVYLNQFLTEPDGTFRLEFPAEMAGGDAFWFQLNGAALEEGVKRLVVIPETSGGSGGASVQSIRHDLFMRGYPDGAFRPDRDITRAETAMLFARLLSEQYEFSGIYTPSFPDVAAGAWYTDCVGFLQQEGLIEGYPDGTFHPDEPISRAEFTAMAVRFEALQEKQQAQFPDVTESHWAYGYIGQAVAQGWINGYEDHTFRPDSSISRAEATAIVHRMLGRDCTRAYVDAQTGWQTFTDVTVSHWAYVEIACAANTHKHVQ